MDRLQAMTAFVKVVESGSFAAAAERLGVSNSAVSRQVSELEAHLNARLLHRTTRRLSLTEAGQAFYERCVQLLADLEESEAAVRAQAVVPKGTLRVTCGVTFGEHYLAPAIADFAARHPQLVFDVDLSDRAVDLVEEGIDLAVRIGPVGSPALVARRLAYTQLVCCASPAYLAQHAPPATPDDLQQHACFAYTYAPPASAWTFEARDGTRHTPRIEFRHRANNGRLLASIAIAGLGVTLEPDFIVAEAVRSGQLVRVLPDYQPPRSPISAVYPSRRHLSAKVRAFVDFLAARFGRDPQWALPAAG